MNVKTTLMGAFAASMVMTAPVVAMAEDAAEESWIPGSFTANVALTSDYVFRGASQSNNRPSVQGGFDWDTGAGLHFGTWAASVNFLDDGTPGINGATTEVDLYGGFAGTIGEMTTYDIGVIYYWYPGASSSQSYDLWEFYGKVGYDFGAAAVNFGVNYSPDNFGGTGDSVYLSSGLSIPVTDKLSFSVGLNYSMLEAPNKDYVDWNVGAKLNVNNWFDVDLRYYDTDIASGCVNSIGRRTCDARVIVTLSRSF